MQTAKIRAQLLKQLKAVRPDKVRRLKAMLRHGDYKVDTRKVAAVLAGR